MRRYQSTLFWFDEILRNERSASLLLNCLVIVFFFSGLCFACIHYSISVHKLAEWLESEEGLPIFAQLGSIIYVNIQENEITERLRSFVKHLMKGTEMKVRKDPILEKRLQKTFLNILKNKLKEEVKIPETKSE